MRRAIWLAALVCALIIGVTAVQAWWARSKLYETELHLTALSAAINSADAEAAEREAEAARSAAGSADLHTSGPVWWTASKLPFVGDDVTAVRTVADVAHELTDTTLPPLVEAGTRLTGTALKPRGGRIPLAPFHEISPTLDRGAAEVGSASQRVNGLTTDGLLSQVRGPVTRLQTELDRADFVLDTSARATELLPSMLGGGGSRNYFLVFQNNAEIKSLGGLAGAFAIINADRGQIELTRTSAPRDVGEFPEPVIDQSPAEAAIFGEKVVTQSQNALAHTNFPDGARVLSTMWERTQGQAIDGVISMDPIALSYILRATGPVTVQGRTLTAENAVDTLLRDIYLQIPTDKAQNDFYAEVTKAIFGRITAGEFAPAELASALAQGVAEHRVMAYSHVASEQKQIATTALAGELPTVDSARPEIGVYLNDSGFDKLTYYLDYRTDITADRCNLGAQRLRVRTTLRSTVPPGELTKFVVGPGSPGLPLGDMRITTYTYGPVGGRIESVSIDGEELPTNTVVHRDRPVGSVTVDIPRGARRVIEYTVYSPRGQGGEATLRTTPGATTDGVGSIGPSAC